MEKEGIKDTQVQQDEQIEDKKQGISQPSDGKKNTDNKKADKNKEIMIPKSRFDEVNNAYKELKAKLAELEETHKKKEQEEAEKRGEFESLYNQTKADLEKVTQNYKTTQKRVEVLEGVINELLEAKLENIDEKYHDLIPENLTPEQKLAWVVKAEKKGLFGNTNAEIPLGEPTNPKAKEEVNVDKMNPLQLLLTGYSKRK